jgi:phosphohistidine phosphatase
MEQLYIMRHAIAEERETFAQSGKADDLRPLTKEGIKKLDQIATKMVALELAPVTLVQSPLKRSQQTVEILAQHFKKAKIKTLESLRPESSFTQLIKDLNHLGKGAHLVVGHETHLSAFTMYLLTGEKLGFMEFKKAGLACLSYEEKIESQKMRLDWLLTPKVCLGL